MTATSGAPASQSNLNTENTILRQQLLVFQEDFDRERQDRAKAQSLKDEYKLKNENLKKRVRHLEQKCTGLESKVCLYEHFAIVFHSLVCKGSISKA